jgi:hypothetical protein
MSPSAAPIAPGGAVRWIGSQPEASIGEAQGAVRHLSYVALGGLERWLSRLKTAA